MSVNEAQDMQERWDKLSTNYDTAHTTVKEKLDELLVDRPSSVPTLTAGQRETAKDIQKRFNKINKPTVSGTPASKDLRSMKKKTDDINDLLNEIYTLNDEVAVTD